MVIRNYGKFISRHSNGSGRGHTAGSILYSYTFYEGSGGFFVVGFVFFFLICGGGRGMLKKNE